MNAQWLSPYFVCVCVSYSVAVCGFSNANSEARATNQFSCILTRHMGFVHISHTGQQQSAVPVAMFDAIGIYIVFGSANIGVRRTRHPKNKSNYSNRCSIDCIPQQINSMCAEMVGYFNLRDADAAGAHSGIGAPICMTNRLLISVKIMQNDH